MPRDLDLILGDILESIAGIEAAVAGLSFEDYAANWTIRRAVERGVEVISEASRRLPPDFLARTPEVDWKSVRGIGNVLRHDYDEILDRIIYEVVHDKLPALKASVLAARSAPDRKA
ncbi:MAG TPA: HepT-like ribonuclease domain-containing protein [Bauldia sp.]|nr:HepT-like ribonuclease domain-containing protein [Bauldia sp.]